MSEMTPEQLAELAGRYRAAEQADEFLPLRLAEDALRYVTHHPGTPLPPNAAELLLSALGRLHQVEDAARALVTGVAWAKPEWVADALRAPMSNGDSLDEEAGR